MDSSLISALTEIVGPDHVVSNDAERATYETDGLAKLRATPGLVVLPGTAAEVQEVVRRCHEAGVPFVASDVGATSELAKDNPDVAVVPLEEESFIQAVRDMAKKLRSGAVDSRRLQAFHGSHFGYDVLSQGWVKALLDPNGWTRVGRDEAGANFRSHKR